MVSPPSSPESQGGSHSLPSAASYRAEGKRLLERGDYAEAIWSFEAALLHPDGLSGRLEVGEAIHRIGVALHQAGQLELAEIYVTCALDLRSESGEAEGWAALLEIPAIARSRGDSKAEAKHLEEALAGDIHPKLLDQKTSTLERLCDVYLDLGNSSGYASAQERLAELFLQLGRDAEAVEALSRSGNSYCELGQHKKAIDLQLRALSLSRARKDIAYEAICLHNLGVTHLESGQTERALACEEEALPLRRKAQDRAGEGRTLNGLGRALASLERFAEAQERYSEVLLRIQPDDLSHWVTFYNLSHLYYEVGALPDALEATRAALDCLPDQEYPAAGGEIHMSAAQILRKQGELGATYQEYERAVPVYRSTSWRERSAELQSRMGTVATELGRPEAALEHYREAASLNESLGDIPSLVRANKRIAELTVAQGDLHGGQREYGVLSQLYESLGDRSSAADAWLEAGRLQRKLKDRDAAASSYSRAAALFLELGDAKGHGGALLNQARALRDAKKRGPAADAYDRAIEAYREAGAPGPEAAAHYESGRMRQSEEPDVAIEHFEKAASLYEEIGNYKWLGETHARLSEIGYAGEKWDFALTHYQRAADAHQMAGAELKEGIARLDAGRIADRIGKPTLGLQNARKAAQIFKELGDIRREGVAQNDAGLYNAHLKQFGVARTHYLLAVARHEAADNKREQITTLFNLGYLYADELAEFPPAAEYLQRAASLCEEIEDAREANIRLKLADVEIAGKSYDRARHTLEAVLALGRSQENKNIQLVATNRLKKLYEQLGYRREAAELQQAVVDLAYDAQADVVRRTVRRIQRRINLASVGACIPLGVGAFVGLFGSWAFIASGLIGLAGVTGLAMHPSDSASYRWTRRVLVTLGVLALPIVLVLALVAVPHINRFEPYPGWLGTALVGIFVGGVLVLLAPLVVLSIETGPAVLVGPSGRLMIPLLSLSLIPALYGDRATPAFYSTISELIPLVALALAVAGRAFVIEPRPSLLPTEVEPRGTTERLIFGEVSKIFRLLSVLLIAAAEVNALRVLATGDSFAFSLGVSVAGLVTGLLTVTVYGIAGLFTMFEGSSAPLGESDPGEASEPEGPIEFA